MKLDLTFSPRLMKTSQAAQYIGVSATKLRELPIPAKRDGGNILYDRIDLDAHADNLPYDGQEENSCDAVFGIEN